MDAKEYITAVVIAAGSGGAGAYVAPVITGYFQRRQKRDELESAHATSVDTKTAVDGTALNGSLWARVEKLEQRLDESDRRGDKLERVLERVARSYEDMRRMVLKLVRCHRENKTPPPELLDDLERVPDVQTMLKGVLDLHE